MEVKDTKLEEYEEKYMAMDMKMVVKDSTGDGEFEPLAEGVYECEYIGTVERTNKDGNKYLGHKWEEVETGQWIFENSSYVVSEKSKLFDIFKACGVKIAVGEEVNLAQLVGKKCNLYLTIDGKYNRIKTRMPVKKGKGASSSPNSPDGIGAFLGVVSLI